ncbi:NAD(P)/FAD-dependent oxidoreductase [Meridianimarinicoccus sp. RP-17]|uniref:NAD(P)/FAD-dependent oxidoreductase n=1 Tax=Meridianimarinicoccus zhengii TaxID=2056810 RepID=UPI000DABEE81|nr:FAD-binding oxidoreductase [Phycocomes zhengii]
MNLLHANDRAGEYPPSLYAARAGDVPRHPPLDGDTHADVCVVGGGYTGLSAALHAARAGLSVRLLEAQRIGFGASGRNGGQVGSGQRVDQQTLEARLGADHARQLWDLGEDAKALVKRLIADHAIPCDWRDGVAHLARSDRAAGAERDHADHLARVYGYDRLEPLDRAGAAQATGARGFAGGVIDFGAGHLDPLAFALGIARAARDAGAVLHEGSEVTGLTRSARWQLASARGTLQADHVILACNGYLGRLHGPTAARVMPINNFIVATDPLTDFPEVLPGGIAVADDRFVVNYWRRSADDRLVFGGGETYGYRFPADIAAMVRPRLAALYPQLTGIGIAHAWGGTLAITRSRLPYLARSEPGLYTAGGYSGHGVALATLAGQLMAEAVAGDAGRFDVMARLPSPPFPGGPALRGPLLVLAMTWFALRDRLGI